MKLLQHFVQKLLRYLYLIECICDTFRLEPYIRDNDFDNVLRPYALPHLIRTHSPSFFYSLSNLIFILQKNHRSVTPSL